MADTSTPSEKAATPPAFTAKARLRSPSYPTFSLDLALKKAKQFFAHAKKYPVTSDVAIGALGYKNLKSSEASRSLSTMISYGLLEDVTKKGAQREVKLSEDAYRLFAALPQDDPERQDILRRFATKPKIYADLLRRYPSGLPADPLILKHLVGDLGFNHEVVADVIRDFRATYQLANLADSGTLSEPLSDKAEVEEETEVEDNGFKNPSDSKPSTGFSAGGGRKVQEKTPMIRTLAIPMLNGREIILQAPEQPMKADLPYLDLLTGYIELMKKQADSEPAVIDPIHDQN